MGSNTQSQRQQCTCARACGQDLGQRELLDGKGPAVWRSALGCKDQVHAKLDLAVVHVGIVQIAVLRKTGVLEVLAGIFEYLVEKDALGFLAVGVADHDAEHARVNFDKHFVEVIGTDLKAIGFRRRHSAIWRLKNQPDVGNVGPERTAKRTHAVLPRCVDALQRYAKRLEQLGQLGGAFLHDAVELILGLSRKGHNVCWKLTRAGSACITNRRLNAKWRWYTFRRSPLDRLGPDEAPLRNGQRSILCERSQQQQPMLKRQKTESVAVPSSLAAGDDELLSGLADWFDDKLKEIAKGAPASDERKGLVEYLDAEFHDMVNALREEQRISVDEVNKAAVARAWRKSGEDACRAHDLQATLAPSNGESHFNFNSTTHASTALHNILSESEDSFEYWRFNLAWDLAMCVMKEGGQDIGSESSDDDEPVEESDSEDGEEEEEESGSGSGSGMSSAEEEDEKENKSKS